MECKDADYVLAIAQCQSINKAASLLHITQPALTKYLRALEERENVALFTRGSTRMVPTAAGEKYIKYAAEIVRLKQDLAQELQSFKYDDDHFLRVGIVANGARNELMRSIDEVKKTFPELSITVTERTSREVENMIASGELDIGFVSLPIENRILQQDILYEEYVLLAVPANSPHIEKARNIDGCPYPWIDLNLFSGQPFVLQNSNTRFRRITDRLLESISPEVNIVMTTRNKISALEFASENNWHCFTTDSFMRDGNTSTSHLFFAVGTPVAKAPIGVIYRRGAKLSVPLKMLEKVLRRRLDVTLKVSD